MVLTLFQTQQQYRRTTPHMEKKIISGKTPEKPAYLRGNQVNINRYF